MTSPHAVSHIYRVLDGWQALLQPGIRRYRKSLLRLIADARRSWASADYGAGYLYQSFPRLGLRGFRQTEIRAEQMAISDMTANRNVLEIGCNSGFLSLTLAPGTRRYVAFDNNPFLIAMARLTQAEVGDTSVEFRVDTMEAFSSTERFDVVLSFANHSTWDGNMTMALGAYFLKLRELMVAGGTLFFESHHPKLEDANQLAETLKVMQEFFAIEEMKTMTRGSVWDRGRTFLRARAKADATS